MSDLRVLQIVEGTSVDGPGLRTSIYLAGCAHHCPLCHNPQSWDFNGGHLISVEELLKTIEYNEFPVTLSGGDPLYSARPLIPLLEQLKERNINVWCYTGFTLEHLLIFGDKYQRKLLEMIDVLVDGPFISQYRDTSLRFRGSVNQRIIDMKTTLREGRIVLWDS